MRNKVIKIYPDAFLNLLRTRQEHLRKPFLVIVPSQGIEFKRSKTETGAWKNAYKAIKNNIENNEVSTS